MNRFNIVNNRFTAKTAGLNHRMIKMAFVVNPTLRTIITGLGVGSIGGAGLGFITKVDGKKGTKEYDDARKKEIINGIIGGGISGAMLANRFGSNKFDRSKYYQKWYNASGSDNPKQNYTKVHKAAEELLENLKKHKTKVDATSEFRAAAMRHHPDKGGDAEVFARVKEAWDDFKMSSKFEKLARHNRFVKLAFGDGEYFNNENAVLDISFAPKRNIFDKMIKYPGTQPMGADFNAANPDFGKEAAVAQVLTKIFNPGALHVSQATAAARGVESAAVKALNDAHAVNVNRFAASLAKHNYRFGIARKNVASDLQKFKTARSAEKDAKVLAYGGDADAGFIKKHIKASKDVDRLANVFRASSGKYRTTGNARDVAYSDMFEHTNRFAKARDAGIGAAKIKADAAIGIAKKEGLRKTINRNILIGGGSLAAGVAGSTYIDRQRHPIYNTTSY